MKYNTVGQSGLKVSELCLGTMTFGREAGVDEARAILDAALEAGVNFIDTANTYAKGASETLIGDLLHGRRHDVVLATKFGNPVTPAPNNGGASRLHILRAVEDSLSRLKTDYLDVYYVHHIDESTPLEETLRALDDLVRQGKVRYIGCSNFEAWRLLESIWISRTQGLSPFVIYQPQYNLLVRDIEDEIVPVAELKHVGIVPWGPLAGGLLTGKYRSVDDTIQGTRSQGGQGFSNRLPFISPNHGAIIGTLLEAASALNRSPESVAIRWLLEKPAVSSVILGARSVEQLQANLAAGGWQLSAEHRERLDEVSRPSPRYPKDSEIGRSHRPAK